MATILGNRSIMLPFTDHEQEEFMHIALMEGRKGIGLTTPNPPVGAVLVADDGTILGKGFHARAGEAHAEVHAINQAFQNVGPDAVKGANLFVTLEPCTTHGRTPPCTEAIVRSGIRRVFIGCSDPNPQNAGGALPFLEQSGISVIQGVCPEDSEYLIRFYKRRIETGRPWVIAKTAMTLDGHTTLPEERGQWISSLESRDDVQQLRRQCDAILVGGETVRTDDPRLTLRGKYAEGRKQPVRIVVTAVKDLPVKARIFNDEFADQTQVYHGQSIDRVLQDVGSQGITSVLMESGGTLFSHAIARKMVDEVVFYIAPVIGGGGKVITPKTGVLADLEDLTVTKIAPDIRITGRVVK